MKEYKTLSYPNTAQGQQQKIRDMNILTNKGWRVVSENISSGQFKGKTACCYASICLPLGFAAGSSDGEIIVTYERETNGQQSGEVLQALSGVSIQHQSGPVRYGDDFSWGEVVNPIFKVVDSTHIAILRLTDKVAVFRQHKWLLPAIFLLTITILSYAVLSTMSTASRY